MTDTLLLEMDGIEKYFSGVHALNKVHFDLRYGEVHALVGENGAGKSTLMKVLTGIHAPDGGEMFLEGKPYYPKSINDSQAAGIGIVHQELNMMNHLTVAQIPCPQGVEIKTEPSETVVSIAIPRSAAVEAAETTETAESVPATEEA